jgi:hypothetical protein
MCSKPKCIVILLFIFSLFISVGLHAADLTMDYNPLVVDSVLRDKVNDTILSEISASSDVFTISENAVMDVQSLRKKQDLSSLYVVSVIILLLIVVLKFKYNNFFQSGILSLANEKIFLLHFRGKKFSHVPALLILLSIRIAVPSLILQYGFYYCTGNKELISTKYFLMLFLLIGAFSLVKMASESLVQSLAGQSKVFTPYITQHLVITSWLWLPSILLVLILYVNQLDVSVQGYAAIVSLPVILASLYSMLRALFIWGSIWRDYLLYFFAYLCTFKILPYLIAAKWLMDNWKTLM